jgi:hypothetical protein
MVLTTHPLLVTRAQMSIAISLLPLWAFEACYRAIFTITFYFQSLSICVWASIHPETIGQILRLQL